jgi:hypothetical protein
MNSMARRLHLWAFRLDEDEWHEVELVNADGVKIRFCCYGDFTGSWPEEWEFSCSCESRPLAQPNGTCG